MSLKLLLPIGRAFAPVVDRRGRYQSREGGVLPRFEDGSRISPAAEGSAGPSGGTAPVGRAVSDPSRLRVQASGNPKRAARRLPVWLEQWVLALVRPGNRRRGTRPVQTEFRLETVKVARNDLTTADVEVVARPGRGGDVPPRLSLACRRRVLRLWWEQGARQLRRIGNMLF